MDIEKWSYEVCELLANRFAKCTDAKEIQEVLIMFRGILLEDAKNKLTQSARVDNLIRGLNRIQDAA